MKQRRLPTAALLLLLSFAAPAAAQNAFFRLADIKPGMKGVGKTCYQGGQPEDFQAEIIGVMRGIGPGANAILARLSGGPLERTGVFEGMSGSPVFIEGKLAGAVAFSFPFAKEALAGITPIEQMVDAFVETSTATMEGPKIILKKSMFWSYLRGTADRSSLERYFASPLMDLIQPALASYSSSRLAPIATPLSVAGFAPETMRRFEPQLRALGLSVLQGAGGMPQMANAGRPPAPPEIPPLQPGSSIIVPLVRGDMDVSAGGTVTYIDGDKLYAFGHPLFNLGFSELPIHKARTLTVLPSLQSSFTILEAGEQVGALRQDRGSGIYGLLGQKARMIPLHIDLTTSRGVRKNLNYEITSDRFLTPYMVNLTIFDSIVASERALGVSTLGVKGKIKIRGQEAVELENRFSTDSNSPAFAALSVALPVNFLLAYGFRNLDVEDINLEIKAVEEDRAAILSAVRIDRSELRAGEVLGLTVVTEGNSGKREEETFPVRIPQEVSPGPVSVLVADGTAIMEMDAQEQGDELIPRDLGQLIKFINNLRKNDRLYVRIFRREPGAVVHGEGLPGLPPSILSILRSERNTGSMSPIQTAPIMEYELPPSDYVVSGSKVLTITVKS
jgi:hypothetical protein